MYLVNFHSYCGMSNRIATCEDETEARLEALAIILARRLDGYTVTTLQRGAEWEVLEPDDSIMVPDDCGILHIKHVTYQCRECGQHWEDKESERYCCSEQEQWDMMEREDRELLEA